MECPRCHPGKRTVPDGCAANQGYIFWVDATPEEQSTLTANGITPDNDGEVPCPTCDKNYDNADPALVAQWEAALIPVDPAIRGLDWAGVAADPEALVPMAKFRFEWVDDDNANVIATPEPPAEDVRIGILSFDADSWCFTRIDRSGDQISGSDSIECDLGREAEIRRMEEDVRTSAPTATVLRAQLKAIELLRREHRDDSRDIATLGATIIARKWWRILWSAEVT